MTTPQKRPPAAAALHSTPSRHPYKKPVPVPADAAAVKLSFSTARFRRTAGPRLSASPARRMKRGGAAVFTQPESASGSSVGSSPEARSEKGTTQSVRPETGREVSESGDDVLRRVLEARAEALREELEVLRGEVEAEEERKKREEEKVRKLQVEDIISRLLSSNDASHTTLPPLPHSLSLAHDPTIPSARPIPVSDPLPQLSAFHALTFTTAHTRLTPSDPSPIQTHTATGFASSRLLYFTLTFTTTTGPSSTITSAAISTSSWSRAELQRPLDDAAERGEVGTILYALSSYTQMAQRRAGVWVRLAGAWPGLMARGGGGGKGKGRRGVVEWLGVSVVRFRSDKSRAGGGVELVVGWEIELGVGGEAGSRVFAEVAVPGGWAEIDELNAMGKISGVFNDLVAQRGVFNAVGCVVGLLFPE